MDRTAYSLLGAVFCIATAGLVYELIAGTAASYLLGDSVTQFSLVIGWYLFAMGLGSYLSRFIERDLLTWFIRLELVVGLVGGFSAFLLFLTYARGGSLYGVLFLLVGGIGAGVGLEIPLLMRILEDRMALKDLVARVLFFDYLGALAASLLFPLLLVPRLGLVKSSLLLGLVNALVGLWVIGIFRDRLRSSRRLVVEAAVVSVALVAGLIYGERLTSMTENDFYPHEIVFAESSTYQRIVMTRSEFGEVRLYLNGHLQFSSDDEYRYHEALVHPALAVAPKRTLETLVLGGGDGMAVRELLRSEDVDAVTLVDLDPAITELFSSREFAVRLNDRALSDRRVAIKNADAMSWLQANPDAKYDVIIVDFPDPSSYSVGKLYTVTFYRELLKHLVPGGAVAIQSTSPMFARRSFWSIEKTLREAGLFTMPYHAHVPSFGEWGYVLATRQPVTMPTVLREGTNKLRFLTDSILSSLFVFPLDMERVVDVPIQRLNDQALIRLYDDELSQYD